MKYCDDIGEDHDPMDETKFVDEDGDVVATCEKCLANIYRDSEMCYWVRWE